MLRNMALVGSTAPATMPAAHRPAFETGVRILFSKWTALQLGVVNEWGGPNSKEKAEGIMEEVIEWFYKKKDHEMLDLADLLDQCISEDFSIQAEDDSPYQARLGFVSRVVAVLFWGGPNGVTGKVCAPSAAALCATPFLLRLAHSPRSFLSAVGENAGQHAQSGGRWKLHLPRVAAGDAFRRARPVPA